MMRFMTVVAALVLGVTVSAQQKLPPYGKPPQIPVPESQKPVFRTGVDLVTLDVSVFDNERRPIRGLTPADFSIFEDGRPQTVAVFSAVEIPDVEPPPAPWMREVAPDVRTNEDLKERRLFLIIIDDAMVEGDVFALKQLREQTRNIINKLGPSDLASVIFTMDNRKSLDFTSDHARLLKTVDDQPMGFRGLATPELRFMEWYWHEASVDVVRRAVEALATLPDRRRAIVYISSGVPIDLSLAAAPAALGLSQTSVGSAAAQAGDAKNLVDRMSQAFQAAARGNVMVNTIDICGLRAPPLGAGNSQTCVPGLETEYLRNVAVATGGRAVVDTNDFDPGVAAIFRDNASYYLLGYQSTNGATDGKFRRIEVRVNRPGVQIKTRNGYVPEKPEAAAKRRAQAAEQPLTASIAGLLPKSDLPMRLTAAPFAIPGRSEVAVHVMLGISQPIRESGGRTVEKVDLQIRAFNTDGKSQGATNLRADVAVRAGATGLAEYEVLGRIDLKPGRYQLRTGANVGTLATAGSLYYDIDVPDFSKESVSLSGLVLTATPSLPVGGIKALMPVMPTTQREFAPGTHVSAFVRIYQGGKGALKTVTLRIRLRDSSNVLVIDRLETLEASRFSQARAADASLALPTARLAAGPYLLSMEAERDGKAASRQITFSVVK